MPKAKVALNPETESPAALDDKPVATEPSAVVEEKVDKPATLLDAVRNAVPTPEEIAEEAPTAPEESDPEPGKEPDTEPVAAETQPEPEPEPEPEAEDPRLDKHPRFQQVLAERNEARAELASVRELQQAHNLSLEQVGQLVTNQVALDDYMRTHHITPDDLDRAVGFASQIKNDPVTGLKDLEAYAAKLREDLGLTLSDDLAQRVEAGYLDEETARELSERRAQDRLQKERNERIAQEQQQQAAAAQQGAHLNTLRSAAVAWEGTIVTRDPDYARKKTLIYDRARTLIADSPPNDIAGVNAIMDRAHKEVSDYLKTLIKPKAVTTQTSNGVSGNGIKPVPKTLAEAIRNA